MTKNIRIIHSGADLHHPVKEAAVPQPRLAIPLSLDPRAVSKHLPKVRGGQGKDEVIERLAETITNTHAKAHVLQTFSAKLEADQTLTQAQKALQIKRSALKVADSLSTKLDGARHQARVSISEIEGQIQPPRPRDAAEAQMHSELRQRLSMMSAEDRLKVTAEKLIDNDTVAALAGAPAWVSGLSQAERDARIASWQRKNFPEQTERLSRLKSAVEGFDRAAGSFFGMVDAVAKDPAAILAEAQELETEAARQKLESNDD
ncbi:hypothetical protein [Methyloceanibacter sp.]|uniref:hypothetical protein n=1 Tax=Methyloceanibacter sp. TaxID=1965321 RepID=UPI003D6D50B6